MVHLRVDNHSPAKKSDITPLSQREQRLSKHRLKAVKQKLAKFHECCLSSYVKRVETLTILCSLVPESKLGWPFSHVKALFLGNLFRSPVLL